MMKSNDWPQNLVNAVFDYGTAINTTKLDTWLSHLSDRERDIVFKRYRDGMTFEAIGKEYAVTRERIRQIDAKAVRKLRHPSNAKDVLVVSRADYDAELEKAKADYKTLLDEHNALKRYVDSLHKAIADEMPQFKEIIGVMSDGVTKAYSHDVPIADMDFSLRTYNCLARSGIKTARELEAMSLEDLKKVRNLGLKSTEEISATLKEFGFSPSF